MKRNPKDTRRRALELKTETVVHLTREQLTAVAGGSVENSMHPSQCVSWCAER